MQTASHTCGSCCVFSKTAGLSCLCFWQNLTASALLAQENQNLVGLKSPHIRCRTAMVMRNNTHVFLQAKCTKGCATLGPASDSGIGAWANRPTIIAQRTTLESFFLFQIGRLVAPLAAVKCACAACCEQPCHSLHGLRSRHCAALNPNAQSSVHFT